MSEVAAELLSDLDGTAFEKLSSKNPRLWWRNGTKTNLAMLDGYPDFLRGVISQGVSMGGAASMRRDWLRRRATERSISEHGLEEFFVDPERIVLAGSEKAKARTVGERSRVVTVGMLEDQPQKHVAELVAYGTALRMQDEVPAHNPILVGVVAHPNSQSRIESLKTGLERTAHEQVYVREEVGTNTGLVIYADPLTIHVTQLEPYSEAGGQEFGQRLVDLAAA